MRRVAIVGFGSAGRRALDTIRKVEPETEFLVVTAQEVHVDQGTVAANYSEVGNFSPDVVVLSGAASRRMEAIEALRDVDSRFFLEKPIASRLDDGERLVKSLEDSGSQNMVGYNLRFSESLSYFRDAIRRMDFGKVLGVRVETGQYLPDWRPSTDYRQSVSARAELGGGVLLELSHEIDYLRWIFGRIGWVSAWLGRVSNLEIDVEDTALLNLGLEDGAHTSDVVASAALDFVRRDKTRRLTSICEGGTIRWDGVLGNVEARESQGDSWKVLYVDPPSHSTYLEQFRALMNLETQRDFLGATLRDGLEVLRVIDAARASDSNNGERVSLEVRP